MSNSRAIDLKPTTDLREELFIEVIRHSLLGEHLDEHPAGLLVLEPSTPIRQCLGAHSLRWITSGPPARFPPTGRGRSHSAPDAGILVDLR
jgi:hypothetical protein